MQKKLPDIALPTDFLCDICGKSKQKRLPFNVSKTDSDIPFDVIHIDISGPTICSMDGYKYFRTIVDDCTRFAWVLFMKTKSEALSKIP